jgi:NAD(P)-dependent dehydrogenase (short-subunit alcohol dehydrogenase family)
MAVRDVTSTPFTEHLSLDGRAAVVIGAAAGIGASVAGRLAEAGCTLVLGHHDEPGVIAFSEQLVAQRDVKALAMAVAHTPMLMTGSTLLGDGGDLAT